MDATRDIPIGQHRYRLERLSARDGSWIVGQFFVNNILFPAISEKAEKITEKNVAVGLSVAVRDLPETTFHLVQDKALACVKRYDENNVAMPLFHKDTGKPLFDLDLLEVTALTMASLAFNLQCFFAPGAAGILEAVFIERSNPAAPGSTPTS